MAKISSISNIDTWIRAVGKNSVLNTKTTTINPQNMVAYIRKDGTKLFRTHELAMNYGKRQIVKALNCGKPFEKSVVINNKLVAFEGNGTNSQCIVPLDSKGIWMHGHPDVFGKGKTLPFSATDFQSFILQKGLEKAIIYNSLGEETSFVKTQYHPFLEGILKKFLPKKNVEAGMLEYRMLKCATGYNKALVNKFMDEKDLKKLKSLSYKIQFARLTKNTAAIEKYSQEYFEIYNKNLELALNNEKSAVNLHEFFKNSQKGLGVIYQTNFSNLNPVIR